jgi:hypothetical protein
MPILYIRLSMSLPVHSAAADYQTPHHPQWRRGEANGPSRGYYVFKPLLQNVPGVSHIPKPSSDVSSLPLDRLLTPQRPLPAALAVHNKPCSFPLPFPQDPRSRLIHAFSRCRNITCCADQRSGTSPMLTWNSTMDRPRSRRSRVVIIPA